MSDQSTEIAELSSYLWSMYSSEGYHSNLPDCMYRAGFEESIKEAFEAGRKSMERV